ncbi:PASTA domain-containing protein [bacterium]|nr:MAG: PASTA domain-containing protein [bacterium]
MDKNRTAILSRLFVILGIVMLFPTAIMFQVFRINVVEGEKLRELWSAQAVDYIPIPAQRGTIMDANNTILVTNSVAYNVAIDPMYRGMNNKSIDTVCHILAVNTGQAKESYLRKIKLAPRGSRYIVLGKGLGIDVYEDLYNLNLKGLILEEQYRRRYNYDSLAAHVVGFINHKAAGMAGLENYYDEELRGEDGSQQVQRDRSNRIRAIVGSPKKMPQHGYHLKTTLDVRMQAILEEELRKGVIRSKADKGIAVIMDPTTGAIKAMANYPSYNPNTPGQSETENRRNFVVADMIEPGSTFKLITAIAAVEQNKVSFEEKFETPKNGQKLIYGQWMRDHDPLGTINFREVIEKSSNVATAEIAMRLNPNDFYQYVRNAGFGNPTNIDLPNEMEGRLRKPHDWSQVTLPWMSVGYEIQVTPIQIAQAYAAFANGGIMMQPYVVDEVIDNDGNIIEKKKPVEVRRIAKSETLMKLKPIFKGVVSDSGTANMALISGLDVAGKTGTAQKFSDGKYRTRYRASFVGFFPADEPQYVCLVIMDEPRTSIYGGTTAAPVFKQVATRLVGMDDELQKSLKPTLPEYFAIVQDFEGMEIGVVESLLKRGRIAYQIKGKGSVVKSQLPISGSKIMEHDMLTLELGEPALLVADERVDVPDLKDLSMREATMKLLDLGLSFEKIGSGTVLAQFPKAGSTVRKGTSVTIRGKALDLEKVSTK